jgi:hypothetical protein
MDTSIRYAFGMEISAKGASGTVAFDGQFVIIRHEGFNAALSTGRSEKRIPLSQISAVQWRPGTRLTNGYISFTMPGVNEVRSRSGKGHKDAYFDENSMMIRHKHTAEMAKVRNAIEQAIAARNSGTTPTSGADEITQLANLHQQGVLTDAEFAAAKAKALGL